MLECDHAHLPSADPYEPTFIRAIFYKIIRIKVQKEERAKQKGAQIMFGAQIGLKHKNYSNNGP